MAREVTMDESGRLVIPKDLRERHRLEAGSRLVVVDEVDRIVLVPANREPRLVERDGLLVVAGARVVKIPDHRALREARLNRVGAME